MSRKRVPVQRSASIYQYMHACVKSANMRASECKINVECSREVWVFFKLRLNASFKMNEGRSECDGDHVNKNILSAGAGNTPLILPFVAQPTHLVNEEGA